MNVPAQGADYFKFVKYILFFLGQGLLFLLYDIQPTLSLVNLPVSMLLVVCLASKGSLFPD